MSQNNHKQKGAIRRQTQLPTAEAIKIAMRSIKIRFWRSFVTTIGIVLAIAFLSSVMSSAAFEASFPSTGGINTDAATSELAKRIWLIAISLVVCVVGITNAMLMSVTERFREIGTMKCLGALDRFVIKLFIIEAAFQGLVGSAAGAVTGFLVALVGTLVQHDDVWATANWGRASLAALAAVLIGIVLSVLGSIYPAYRAGKMPPADAMRTEV